MTSLFQWHLSYRHVSSSPATFLLHNRSILILLSSFHQNLLLSTHLVLMHAFSTNHLNFIPFQIFWMKKSSLKLRWSYTATTGIPEGFVSTQRLQTCFCRPSCLSGVSKESHSTDLLLVYMNFEDLLYLIERMWQRTLPFWSSLVSAKHTVRQVVERRQVITSSKLQLADLNCETTAEQLTACPQFLTVNAIVRVSRAHWSLNWDSLWLCHGPTQQSLAARNDM
jgi:hypothetical protein